MPTPAEIVAGARTIAVLGASPSGPAECVVSDEARAIAERTGVLYPENACATIVDRSLAAR